MIPVLSRAQMREYDRYAFEACHVPGIVRMLHQADWLTGRGLRLRRRLRRGR